VPRYPVSDHCDGARFFNPYAPAGRSLAEVWRWMRTRERTAWPASVPSPPVHPPPPAHVEPGHVAVTFIGHSTFLVRTASAVMITDPVFTTHAGPFGRLGPRRVRPPAIALRDLPRVDLVLLSHNHYDHLQPSSLAALSPAALVTALGVGRHVPPLRGRHVPPEGGSYRSPEGSPPEGGRDVPPEGGRDVPPEGGRDVPPEGGSYELSHGNPVAAAFRRNVQELDWWQSVQIGDATITAVPAQHFSARTAWDRNATLWCGFVVEVDGVTIYFAGDTGYTPQFAEIGDRFPAVDVALLPIGAYEPRWFMEPVHMNPDEAVRAHVDAGARVSVGMHFGTFQLTDEGIDDPLRALDAARTRHDVAPSAFRVLDFGETCVLRAAVAERHRRPGDHEARR
jgi:L-ascorbate metabolism protein UlaG (beta-lactamase superfamily)